MSYPPGHDHVSERQSGKWEDCVWMSGIEWLRQVHDRAIPATHEEGDALRLASGDLGFSNLGDLDRGTRARYQYALPSLTLASNLWPALMPGRMAIVIGSLTAWPKGSHWRRWDPESTANHAATAYRFDSTDQVWWCDPLAPEVMGDGRKYLGEPMPKAELLRFVGALGAEQLVGKIISPVEVDMVPVTPSPEAQLIDIAVGIQLYGLDRLPLVINGKSIKTTGSQFGKFSFAHADPAFRVVALDVGVDQLLLIKATAALNVRSACPPAPAPDCTGAVDAATAPLKAQVSALVAKIAAAQADLA